jgi:hypothetical protein
MDAGRSFIAVRGVVQKQSKKGGKDSMSRKGIVENMKMKREGGS